jgi:hypothetical protein
VTTTPRGSSAPARQPDGSESSMKGRRDPDEARPEYDFTSMTGGVRGKYAESFKRGTNLVRLDADVAAAFKSDRAVNEALRAVLQAVAALQASPDVREPPG